MRDMREILFRGKRVDNGEWIYGSLLSFPKGRPFIVSEETLLRCKYCDNDIVSCAEEIIPETRGEYTGLTDKNGVKIFEGDILRFINTDTRGEWLCTVEFHEGAFIGRNIKDKSNYCHFDFWNMSIVQWEVVDKLHDNPELLEGDGEA